MYRVAAATAAFARCVMFFSFFFTTYSCYISLICWLNVCLFQARRRNPPSITANLQPLFLPARFKPLKMHCSSSSSIATRQEEEEEEEEPYKFIRSRMCVSIAYYVNEWSTLD